MPSQKDLLSGVAVAPTIAVVVRNVGVLPLPTFASVVVCIKVRNADVVEQLLQNVLMLENSCGVDGVFAIIAVELRLKPELRTNSVNME